MANHLLDDMNPAAMRRRLRPSEALQYGGATREPVGGGSVQVPVVARGGAIPQPTGFTRPLLVTANSQEIFPVDFARKFIFIQNNDALGIVFISFGGQAAALNQGFRLGANGGFVLLDINVLTDRVFAIGTIAANPNVTAITG